MLLPLLLNLGFAAGVVAALPPPLPPPIIIKGGGSGGVSGGDSKTISVTKKTTSKYKNRSNNNTKITVTYVKDGEELKKIIYVKKANVTVDDIKLSLVESEIKINVKR